MSGLAPCVEDAEAAVFALRRRHEPLVELEGDGREGDLVVQVLEAAAGTLEVELHLAELTLNRQRGADRVRPVEQLEQLAFDGFELARAGTQVDVFLRDVLTAFAATFDTPESGKALIASA